MDSTMSQQGTSSASPTSVTRPTILPPDFLDASIDDIVVLIGEIYDFQVDIHCLSAHVLLFSS